MRCPDCNARNAETADWCTQCYASLAAPEPEPPPSPAAPASSAAPAPAEPTWPTGPTPSDPVHAPPRVGGTDEPVQIVQRGNATFRKTVEGLEWQCALCEGFNPIEVQYCAVCGHSFSRTVKGPEERVVPEVSENTALLASAVLPGAGHYLAGQTTTAVGRAVMYVLFVVGGWLLLNEAGASGQSPLPAIPLLLGALVIWVATAYDAVQAAKGDERQILVGRMFLWLVVGVLGLLMLTFAAAALSVSAA